MANRFDKSMIMIDAGDVAWFKTPPERLIGVTNRPRQGSGSCCEVRVQLDNEPGHVLQVRFNHIPNIKPGPEVRSGFMSGFTGF